MKKRILSILLIAILVFSYCGSSLAVPSQSLQPRAAGIVTGGLAHISGSIYELWGSIRGVSSDQLTIRVVLYKGSNYITEISNSGSGPYVETSMNVILSSGTYTLYIYGTTPTNSPQTTKTVTI
ncbi:MAG TPA: hypothetical protein PKW41_07020 [Clostridia bacterium]|nr:hypothetical protein [Clostridia bacterium]